MLEDCQLVDCSFLDDEFTCHRGNVRERLDRALANDAWNNLFSGETMHHLNYYKSDHKSILMPVDEELAQDRPDPYLFRFEALWVEEKDFPGIVEGCQEKSGPSSKTFL